MSTEKKRVVIEFDQKGARVVKGSLKDIAKDARSAQTAVGKMRSSFGSATAAVKKIGTVARSSFHLMKKGIDIALAPLKLMLKTMLGLKVATLAVGLSTTKAAASYEAMKTTLLAVTLNAKKAKEAFDESRAFSVATPYTPSEIVQTRTRFESVGIRGNDAVKAAGEVAAAMNRRIEDVALGVISMETEVMRKLGVQVKQNMGQFTFEYENALGKTTKITTAGFKNAQEEVLRIFGEKYKGGLERLSKTVVGLWSTLKGEFTDLQATIGAKFAPQIKTILRDLIALSANIKESFGEDFGKGIAAALDTARAHVMATASVLKEVFSAMKEIASTKGIGYVILESLKAGATILGSVFLEALKASLSIWQTIGTVIGTAMYNFLLTTDLPFAKGAQTVAAGDIITGGGLDQASMAQLIKKYGVGGGGSSQEKLAGFQYNIRDKELRREFQADVIAMSGQRKAADLLTEQFTNTKEVFSSATKTILDTTTKAMGEFGETMGMKGDPAKTYAKTLGERTGETFKKQADPKKIEIVTQKQITLAERLNGQWEAFEKNLTKAFYSLDKAGNFDGGKMAESFSDWMDDAANMTEEVATLVESSMDGFVDATTDQLWKGQASWEEYGEMVVGQLQRIATEMLVVQGIELLKNAGKSLLDKGVETGTDMTVDAGTEVAKNAATTAAIAEGGVLAATAMQGGMTIGGTTAAAEIGLGITGAGGGAAAQMATAITASGAAAAAQMGSAIVAAGAASSAMSFAQFGATSTGNTPYIVGEQRAEMVIPPLASRIVPNASVNEGANGGNYDGGTVRMIVTTDTSAMERYMRSPEGEKAAMKIYHRNKNSMR